MVVTSIAEAWPPQGQLFTADDLDRMPDDGRRYELLDGVLIVSPRPIVWHQKVAFELAVELNQKRAAYQKFGVPSDWIVNPDRNRPTLTVFELDGQEYREVARVAGNTPFLAKQPFEVEIIPARLVGR
jgi:Uma2 family endonuclease